MRSSTEIRVESETAIGAGSKSQSTSTEFDSNSGPQSMDVRARAVVSPKRYIRIESIDTLADVQRASDTSIDQLTAGGVTGRGWAPAAPRDAALPAHTLGRENWKRETGRVSEERTGRVVRWRDARAIP
ncbi:hypothetical protein EVAR_78952_1 [Eumeta japonica]|uniref:Uncharacterized protein n=1 Tax=Eumeta variegata TaxID=151549 RepID=A0A4C1US22_EUMVA|nr:hypothetical protein EVAR_78952_1 [Eumeta japonica]